MSLFAHLTFDDEDTELHLHMTTRAHVLEDQNPAELCRVLRTLEAALSTTAERVAVVRATIEGRLEHEAMEREARGG